MLYQYLIFDIHNNLSCFHDFAFVVCIGHSKLFSWVFWQKYFKDIIHALLIFLPELFQLERSIYHNVLHLLNNIFSWFSYHIHTWWYIWHDKSQWYHNVAVWVSLLHWRSFRAFDQRPRLGVPPPFTCQHTPSTTTTAKTKTKTTKTTKTKTKTCSQLCPWSKLWLTVYSYNF